MKQDAITEMSWDAIPYNQRLAATAHVFQVLCEHARDGGTFRFLIYQRLGFKEDAYAPLFCAGGMDISNEFELPPQEEP